MKYGDFNKNTLKTVYSQIEVYTKFGADLKPVNKITDRDDVNAEIQYLASSKPLLQNLLLVLCNVKLNKHNSSQKVCQIHNAKRRKVTMLINHLNSRLVNLAQQLDFLNSEVFENKLVDETVTQNIDCSICLENIKNGETSTSLKNVCKHQFHRKCIKLWLATKSSCPVCRANFIL